MRQFQIDFILLLIKEVERNQKRDTKLSIKDYQKAMAEAWTFFKDNFAPVTNDDWKKMIDDGNALADKYKG